MSRVDCIHFIGDATDDLRWVSQVSNNSSQQSVERLLPTTVGGDCEVHRHAYLGEDNVPPLADLCRNICDRSGARHYVVLSVGNFRETLRNPFSLIRNIRAIQEHYLTIIEALNNIKTSHTLYTIQPILMFQYRPGVHHNPYWIYPVLSLIYTIAFTVNMVCLALLTAPLWIAAGKVSAVVATCAFFTGVLGLYSMRNISVSPITVIQDLCARRHIGVAMLGILMRSFYKPILEIATQKHIPVLDLCNMMNPLQDALYTSGTEPSSLGSQLIARGISYIANNYTSLEDKICSAQELPTDACANPSINPKTWTVA